MQRGRHQKRRFDAHSPSHAELPLIETVARGESSVPGSQTSVVISPMKISVIDSWPPDCSITPVAFSAWTRQVLGLVWIRTLKSVRHMFLSIIQEYACWGPQGGFADSCSKNSLFDSRCCRMVYVDSLTIIASDRDSNCDLPESGFSGLRMVPHRFPTL